MVKPFHCSLCEGLTFGDLSARWSQASRMFWKGVLDMAESKGRVAESLPCGSGSQEDPLPTPMAQGIRAWGLKLDLTLWSRGVGWGVPL